MSTIKVVAFDCDGVMFDTTEVNRMYYNLLLAHFGRPPVTEAQLAFVHQHAVEEAVNMLFDGDADLVARVHAYRRTMDYRPLFAHMIIEPHLKAVLDWLKQRVRTAVVTNRTDTIGPVLDTFGLSHRFDAVISALDVRHPKPHPEPLLKILDLFAVNRDEVIYVGDSGVDEAAATAAGVPLAAYRNPGLAAAWHIEGLDEILGIVNGRY